MKLNQVTLPSSDLEKSVRFYEKMGFQLIVDARPRYARFLCTEGEATFSLHFCEKITPGDTYIYFETQDPDAKYCELLEAGFDFELPPVDQRWLWREARLRDPDGNLIIIYRAGENRIRPPWRVNP
jgi:catechol 2,3-dioxygenase-like lactoylglutathione lyase family enzyme